MNKLELVIGDLVFHKHLINTLGIVCSITNSIMYSGSLSYKIYWIRNHRSLTKFGWYVSQIERIKM